MAATKRLGRTAGAALFAAAVFVVSFLWLHDAAMFLPHQGVQSVLAADSLLAGRGFEISPGIPFVKFGPLYPLLLSALGRLGLEVTPAVYAINCAAFAVTLFGLLVLGQRLGIRGAWVVGALFSVFAPNHYLLRAARPDAVVIAATFVALIGMVAYAGRPTVGSLSAIAAACSVAAATRYMALPTLLPVFGVALLLARGLDRRRRLVDLAVFGAIAAGPTALWMLRNYRLTGFLTGMSRSAADARVQWAEHYGLGGNLLGLVKTSAIDACGWGAVGTRRVVYGDVPLPLPWLGAAGALALAALLAAAAWRGRAELARGFAGRDGERGRALLIAGTHAMLYAVVLIVLWTVSNNDPIETRYVAPLYGFAFLAAALVLEAGTRGLTRSLQAGAIVTVLAVVAVPNVAKSLDLLADAPPGPALMPVTVVGPRGTNWVGPLTWTDVGPSDTLD